MKNYLDNRNLGLSPEEDIFSASKEFLEDSKIDPDVERNHVYQEILDKGEIEVLGYGYEYGKLIALSNALEENDMVLLKEMQEAFSKGLRVDALTYVNPENGEAVTEFYRSAISSEGNAMFVNSAGTGFCTTYGTLGCQARDETCKKWFKGDCFRGLLFFCTCQR